MSLQGKLVLSVLRYVRIDDIDSLQGRDHVVVNFQLMRTEEIKYYYIKMLRENACNKTFEFVVCLSPIPFGLTNSDFWQIFCE